MKINILGTSYQIKYKNEQEDEYLKQKNGYCDFTTKEIVCIKFNDEDKNIVGAYGNFNEIEKEVLRHEIIHAFIYESGLWGNTYGANHWATNEEMTDWFAIQSPKIFEVYKKLNILDKGE